MSRLLAAAAALPLFCAPAFAQDATAALATADGGSAGTVEFRRTTHGVIVKADLTDLSTGWHGFHIHQTGDCSGDFSAAGGHYAANGNGHGYDAEDGYHAGDLPNIHVAEDGTAMAEFFTDRVSLDDGAANTLFDGDGSAIMVHAQADTYEDEAGAGDRVACGVIETD